MDHVHGPPSEPTRHSRHDTVSAGTDSPRRRVRRDAALGRCPAGPGRTSWPTCRATPTRFTTRARRGSAPGEPAHDVRLRASAGRGDRGDRPQPRPRGPGRRTRSPPSARLTEALLGVRRRPGHAVHAGARWPGSLRRCARSGRAAARRWRSTTPTWTPATCPPSGPRTSPRQWSSSARRSWPRRRRLPVHGARARPTWTGSGSSARGRARRSAARVGDLAWWLSAAAAARAYLLRQASCRCSEGGEMSYYTARSTPAVPRTSASSPS